MNTHKEPKFKVGDHIEVVRGSKQGLLAMVIQVNDPGLPDQEYKVHTYHSGDFYYFDEEYLRLAKVEPTPPSQIEEESQTQRSLREMYELGKEHGRTLALKDMEIEKLLKEIKGE